jgi:hypothetical protein
MGKREARTRTSRLRFSRAPSARGTTRDGSVRRRFVCAKRRATRGPAPQLTAETLHVRRRHTGPLKKGAVSTRTDNVRGRPNNGWASALG